MKKKITIISISIIVALILLVASLIIFNTPKDTSTDASSTDSTTQQVESNIPTQTKQGVSWANKIWTNKRDVSEVTQITVCRGEGSNLAWSYGDVVIDLLDTQLFIYTNESIPVTSAENMFAEMTKLESIQGIELFDFSNCENFQGMFYNCSKLSTLDLTANSFSKAKNMSQMFYGCAELKSFKINDMTLSQVVNMSQMFEECVNIESLQMPETPVVTNISRMFKGLGYGTDYGCTINGSMSFPSCTDYTELFLGAHLVSLDFVNEFDMSKAVTTERMFCDATCPEDVDLSKWNTINLQNTYEMFLGASNIRNINLDGWDCSNLTSCEKMFHLTTAHNISLQWKNVIKLENTNSMFNAAMALTEINLSGFNNIHLKEANQMFMDCYELKQIICNGFTADLGTEAFYKCNLLKGAIPFDESKTDISMATTQGYFTN